MPRAATLALASAFCLLGCVQAPKAWNRTDGLPIGGMQLEADTAACKGEANKANLSAGRSAVLSPDLFGYSSGMMAVYRGCMAEKGYLPEPGR